MINTLSIICPILNMITIVLIHTLSVHPRRSAHTWMSITEPDSGSGNLELKANTIMNMSINYYNSIQNHDLNFHLYHKYYSKSQQ